MLETSIEYTAQTVFQALKTHNIRLVSAESCTGGLLATSLTAIAGASDIFERGYITYANKAKQDLLGVQAATLNAHGAVSAQTAREMARGALDNSESDMAIAITGIAGPGGGTAHKPIGLVYIGVCSYTITPVAEEMQFAGDRQTVRMETVLAGMKMLMRYLEPTEE